mmetsp:Transcript_6901/g.935  ORF Transcript_6901/g.935 Transcript_6901/m.935 type:complete len:130 (-) Transcript_6901:114-503(-)
MKKSDKMLVLLFLLYFCTYYSPLALLLLSSLSPFTIVPYCDRTCDCVLFILSWPFSSYYSASNYYYNYCSKSCFFYNILSTVRRGSRRSASLNVFYRVFPIKNVTRSPLKSYNGSCFSCVTFSCLSNCI